MSEKRDYFNKPQRLTAVYLGNTMPHDEKYLLINQAFAGKQRFVPFFNRSNNEDLILAIQTAGVSRGATASTKTSPALLIL